MRTDLVGFGPFIAIMAWLWGRTIWAASRYGGYPLATAIGLASIIFAAIAYVLLVIRTHPFTRWFLCVFGIALLGIGVIFAIAGEFKGMYVLIGTCGYEGVYGIIVGHDIIRHLPRQRMTPVEAFKLLFPKPARREITGLALCLAFGISGLISTQVWQFDARSELRFSVTTQSMQNAEIGLYLADSYDYADPQAFIDILKDTNTTLLLQGNPDLFREINGWETRGKIAANLTKLCNLAGVKVEIWPVGSQNFSCALSLRSVDCMPVVYQYFKDWVARHNITVQYYAFDIEDWVARPLIDASPFSGALGGIHDMAENQYFMRINRSNWAQLIAQQQALIDQIRADGYIPRGTINNYVLDALDGDYNGYAIDFMQSYEIRGYEYLSAMVYRSCEGGNNDSSYNVYKYAHLLDAVSPYPKSAICIGCIGYPAYETKEDIANDVWLSVAAGVDSVRIFRVESWLNREANETAGFNAVRDMLELCRAGGTTVTEYRAAWDNAIFGSIIGDVFGDL